MIDTNYEHIDAGVRRTVRWLNKLGYQTCDSGDGSKASWMDCARDYPHVVIQLEKEEIKDACAFADEIKWVLEKKGMKVVPCGSITLPQDKAVEIQLSYDPANSVGMIDIMYIDDSKLPDWLEGEPAIEVK